MNNIEQLEERIAQLTELVKSGSEAIESMKTALIAAEKERDRLADQRREQESKFERVDKGAEYYTIYVRNACPDVIAIRDNRCFYDNKAFTCNNYFYTEERSREVADKINLLLKLERLHDIYCPDYKPSWEEDNNTYRYFVYYDNANGVYYVTRTINAIYPSTVYFPTEEIAQKVCDALNG